jgi:hypothetical protein
VESREEDREERRRRPEDLLARVVDEARARREIPCVPERDVGIVDEPRAAPERDGAERGRGGERDRELGPPEGRGLFRRPGRRGRIGARRGDGSC